MHPVMRRVLIALVAPLALASCSTTRPAAVQPQPAAAPPGCLAVKAYTLDQLEQMAAAVRALPPDSPLRGLVVDYARLRDEARAECGGAVGAHDRSRLFPDPGKVGSDCLIFAE
jgi:hypothetical protein